MRYVSLFTALLLISAAAFISVEAESIRDLLRTTKAKDSYLRASPRNDEHEEHEPGVHVAQWNWDHVGVYLTITAFIVISGLAKVGE